MKFGFGYLAIIIFYSSNSFSLGSGLIIPEGFEELAKEQSVFTDVSLYGNSLGVFQIRVDLENIQFIQPEAIVDAINKIYANAPDLDVLLRKRLGKRFRRNGNLSCSSNGDTPGCDFLSTDTLDIIYDENNSRVNLFIGSKYLPEKRQQNIYYENTQEVRNALIHQQNINFVADDYYKSISLQGNGSLGVTENGYLNIDWRWQEQRSGSESARDIYINNAYLRQDLLKKFYMQVGIMDARDIFSNTGGNIDLSQLPLGKIRGLRAGSTLAWINHDRVSKGTPVNVFLSRDARVDAYRDKQLLASFYLKAGAQELDSRAFPAGSYPLILRIYEDNQLVRTETLSYTGLGDVKPDTFQWFLQAGTPDTDNSSETYTEKQAIQAGMRLPLYNNAAVTTGTAIFNTARYWEGAVEWSHGFSSGWVDGLLTGKASYLYGNEGSRGNIQQVSYNDGFSMNIYRSSMTADNCNSLNTHSYGINGCYKNINVMLSVPFNQWYGTVGYSISSSRGRYVYRRDLADYDGRNQVGIPWEKVYQTYFRSQTLQAGITGTFYTGGITINSSINAFVRDESAFRSTDKGVFVTFTVSGNKKSEGGNRQAFSSGVSWQTSRRGNSQLGYNTTYSQYTGDGSENETGVSLYGVNTDTVNSSIYGRLGGQYGQGSLTISDSWESTIGKHRLSSSGNFSSSFIVDQEGSSFGRWGDGSLSSAITIAVDSEELTDKSGVSVSVDNAGSSNVRGNSRGLFVVPGYRESTVDVTEPLGSPDGISSEIAKGIGARKVFMTPGKVLNRKIDVFSRYTWLGRLLDEQRRPLEGAIPLNVASWTPLGEGNFTLETTKEIRTLYVMKNSTYWQCKIKAGVIKDVIRYTGTTSCKSTKLTNLPSAESKQVALMNAGTERQMNVTAQNREEKQWAP